MNSLSYLSRQFDAVIASSSSSSTPASSSQPRTSYSTPPSPVSSSSTGHPSRSISPRFKRVKSSSSIPQPQSPTLQQAPVPPSELSPPLPSPFNSNMSSSSPLIRPKSSPDLLSRLVFVRLLFLLWSLLRAAWKSLSIRRQHMVPEHEAEAEPEIEVIQVDEAVDLDGGGGGTRPRSSSSESMHSHRQQPHSSVSPYLHPLSNLSSPSLSLLSPRDVHNRIRTLTPTPPPTPPPHRPTPFLSKTLVLDLDETLIHSTSRPLHHHSNSSSNLLGLRAFRRNSLGSSHTVEVVLGGRNTTYHVYKRPFVDYFLRKVSTWYTLVIFTASMQEYADPVIDWLDAGRGILSKRLFRESCTQLPNGSYTKDLTIVESDLARVCLVDNSPISYNINEANGIPIEGWTHDPHDEALLELLPVLDSLRFSNDVRHILGIRGFS